MLPARTQLAPSAVCGYRQDLVRTIDTLAQMPCCREGAIGRGSCLVRKLRGGRVHTPLLLRLQRDGPPITRDEPPSLLILQGRSLTVSLSNIPRHCRWFNPLVLLFIIMNCICLAFIPVEMKGM